MAFKTIFGRLFIVAAGGSGLILGTPTPESKMSRNEGTVKKSPQDDARLASLHLSALDLTLGEKGFAFGDKVEEETSAVRGQEIEPYEGSDREVAAGP